MIVWTFSLLLMISRQVMFCLTIMIDFLSINFCCAFSYLAIYMISTPCWRVLYVSCWVKWIYFLSIFFSFCSVMNLLSNACFSIWFLTSTIFTVGLSSVWSFMDYELFMMNYFLCLIYSCGSLFINLLWRRVIGFGIVLMRILETVYPWRWEAFNLGKSYYVMQI